MHEFSLVQPSVTVVTSLLSLWDCDCSRSNVHVLAMWIDLEIDTVLVIHELRPCIVLEVDMILDQDISLHIITMSTVMSTHKLYDEYTAPDPLQ
jgi:hypothetical protein